MKFIKNISFILITIFLLFILFIPSNYPLNAENINWVNIRLKNEDIIKHDPENIMANFELIVAMANLGEIEKTYSLINKLGEKISINKFDTIIKPYLNKLENDKDNLLLLNYAAFYELIKNEHREAINYFEKITVLNPENIWIQNYMASCYIEINDYKKAEMLIKNSQKIKDSNFSHLLMGLIYYKKGNYIDSIVEFSKSGKLFSTLLAELK